jgi:hypothetical protein
VYTTFRPFDAFSLVPSFEYRGNFYQFPTASVQPLSRGFLVFQSELGTQFERVYETDDPDSPRIKHLIRPRLVYSYIPVAQQSLEHPFSQQIAKNTGYIFDNRDVIPISSSTSLTNYQDPLGHSLTYGFVSQLIRRNGSLKSALGSYETLVSFSANQNFNFLDPNIPIQPLYSSLSFSVKDIAVSVSYIHNFFLERRFPTTFATMSPSQYIVNLNYAPQQGPSGALRYEYYNTNNSVSNLKASLGFNINAFIVPSFSATYDFNALKFQDSGAGVSFYNPSQCWYVGFNVVNTVGSGVSFQLNFALNLTGTGYQGVNQIAQTYVPM